MPGLGESIPVVANIVLQIRLTIEYFEFRWFRLCRASENSILCSICDIASSLAGGKMPLRGNQEVRTCREPRPVAARARAVESTRPRQTQRINADRAMLVASEFVLFHYPTLFTGGIPRRLSLQGRDLWIVPIVLTHPEYGVVGDAGIVAIDARTGRVLGSTPRREVVAAGKRLRKAKRDALETAFLQTGA